jgi:hypothetical protein
MNMSYADVMSMPTYERRFFIRIFTEQLEKQKEKAEEQQQNATASNGKGKRVTRISGNAVKNYSGRI